MSYSFSVRAATSAALIAAASSKLDEVVASQPVHEADRDAALGVVENMVALVPVPVGMDYSANVSGWVSTINGALVGASVSVTINTISNAG